MQGMMFKIEKKDDQYIEISFNLSIIHNDIHFNIQMSLLTHLSHLIDHCSHFHHQVRPHQQMFDFYRLYLLYLLLYYGINTLCAFIISLNNLLRIFRAILNILAINYITLTLPLSFWRLSIIILILL